MTSDPGETQQEASEATPESSEATPLSEPVVPVTQKVYEQSNNSKKMLFLLCLGLKNEDGQGLFDLEAEPWNQLKKRSLLKPSRHEYAQEICRRASVFKAYPFPRTSNWSVSKAVQWLEANPVSDTNDVAFLQAELKRFRDITIAAMMEAEADQIRQSGHWVGKLPYLRLILCVVEDDIKYHFLHRADVMTRPQLDARNSESRPPTAFELISNRWNDPNFNPVAPASSCHEDFMEAISCDHTHVASMAPATAQKVEDIITSMRSNLLRIIQNWERSGQGEGGHHDPNEFSDETENQDSGSPAFGTLGNRSESALQNRASFLCGKPSYLLYYWEMADRHQLLQSAMQRLDDSVSAPDAASVPPVHGGQRRRQRDSFEQSISVSLNRLADTEDARYVRQRIDTLEDKVRDYRQLYAEVDDPNSTRARFYYEEARDIMEKVAELQQEYSELQDKQT